MKVNYHTHTARCRHASGTEREYIEKAIAAGIETLGFADHVPYPFPDGYQSGMRMSMSELEEYVRCLSVLREEYKKDIRILIGFESEYYPELFGELTRRLDQVGYDYLIMGQHHLKDERLKRYCGRPTEKEEDLAEYVREVIEGLETGRFLYLAHPDLLHFTGNAEVYHKHMEKLCRRVKELNIPLEINLLGLWEGRNYPSGKFFQIAAKTGNQVILGLDAHKPEAFEQAALIEAGYRFAKNLGLEVVDKLI